MPIGRGAGRLVILAAVVALVPGGRAEADPEELRRIEALLEAGERDRAIAEARDLLARVESASGADSLEAAEVLDVLVPALKASGRDAYAEALDLARRAVTIRERTPGAEHPGLVRSLKNLGSILDETSRFVEAQEAYTRALAIQERSLRPDHSDAALTLESLAGISWWLDDIAGSQQLCERSVAITERALGPDHVNLAGCLGILSAHRGNAGDHEESRALAERRLAVLTAHHGPEHPEVADALNSLANRAADAGEYAEAEALLGRALAIIEKTRGPEARGAAMVRFNLGALLLDGGDYGRAGEEYRRALEIWEKHLPPEDPTLAMARGALGKLLTRMGDFVLARPLLDEALRLHEQSSGPTDPDVALDLQDLASLLAEQDETIEARRLLERSRDQDAARYRAALARAWQRKEEAESRLAVASAEFRRRQGLQRISRADIQALLPRDGALVEIARVARRDLALILRADGGSQHVDLGPAEAIDRLADHWRAELAASGRSMAAGRADADARARLDAAGADLRRTLWDPVAAHLDRVDRVFLVPDGAMHRVDVGALPAPDGRYLAEAGPTLHLLSTGRDLARFAREAPRSRPEPGLLALGDPDFDAGILARAGLSSSTKPSEAVRGARPACLSAASTRWTPLPDSAREVRAIASLLEGREPVATLTGGEATEERFRQEAPRRRMLHMATHGFFLERGCADPSGPDSPLLRSGLVLAGANRAEARRAAGFEDGILTAEEIAALDLRGVGLAVLSACDTGRGDVAVGEGVLGLRRAFEIAGVRTIVMSLWTVPDRQARRWAARFYRGILGGLAPAEAARRSSLESLRELRQKGRWAHPSYWAGFVVAGDWR